MDKSLYWSTVQYERKSEKNLKNYLGLKLKKTIGNGRVWLYQLQKEP